MLQNIKRKNSLVDIEIQESEVFGPFFDLSGTVIGEKIKISKKINKKAL